MKKNKLIIIGLIATIIVITVVAILLIKNKKITYNVIFETDGGSLIESQTVGKEEQVMKPDDPVKNGYIFVEWVYEGKTYDFSQNVTSDLELIAKWTILEEDIELFSVKFDSDGGTTISNQIIKKGDVVEKPVDPEKNGYVFKGWMLNDDIFDFQTVVNEDITLKAKWEKIQEVSNTNKKNNTNTTNNTSKNIDNSADNKTTNSTDNKTDNKTDDKTTNSSDNKTDDKKENTIVNYTVSFNSNGGSSVDNQTIESGKKASKPENPSKDGYTFVGWYLNDVEYNFSSTVTDNITLVAFWKNNTWDIESSTGSIVKYKGSDSDVTIPSVIDGTTILNIKSNAFSSSLIKSLYIPSSVKTIESSAILKSSNSNLTKVYVKNDLWKSTNWESVFGTTNSAYVTGDSGVLIKSVYKLDKCDMYVFSGSCSASKFVHVINSDGIYPIYYDIADCWISNGGSGILSVEIPYYVTSDSYTLFRPSYSNFKGWIGDNGNTPQKNVTIPVGSTGEKHYTAVCSS